MSMLNLVSKEDRHDGCLVLEKKSLDGQRRVTSHAMVLNPVSSVAVIHLHSRFVVCYDPCRKVFGTDNTFEHSFLFGYLSAAVT